MVLSIRLHDSRLEDDVVLSEQTTRKRKGTNGIQFCCNERTKPVVESHLTTVYWSALSKMWRIKKEEQKRIEEGDAS